MRKFITLVALATPAFATSARLITMGGQLAYLLDESAMDLLPTTAHFFPNWVVAEIREDISKSSLILNLNLGDRGRFGKFYLHGNKAPGSPGNSMNYRFFTPGFRYPLNPGVEAGYTKDIGYLLLGFRVGHLSSLRQAQWGTARADLSYGRLGVGWVREGLPVEGAVSLYYFNGRNDSLDCQVEGALARELTARALWALSDQTALVLGAHYYDDDLSDQVKPQDDYTELSANLGFRVRPLEGYTLVAGLNYYLWEEQAGWSGYRALNLSTGVEASITRFLIFRIGLSKNFYGRGWEGSQESFGSEFDYNIGLGFKVEELQIDGLLSRDFLFKGPYLIGGEPVGLFGLLSVRYHFRTF